MEKDEAIRRAAETTQPEASMAVDGFMVVRTATLGDLEMKAGRAGHPDAARLTAAIASEVHIDEAHGFPPGFTAADLAANIIREYDVPSKSK